MNARLHPAMQPFVQWFAPAANAQALQSFFVRFIRGGIVEAQFEAMAPDSIACVQQHIGAANGAKVDVMPLAAWREKCAAEARARLDAKWATPQAGDLTQEDLEAIDREMGIDKARNRYDSRRDEEAVAEEAKWWR